jgi:cation diffusion facilitator family transporter
MSVPIAESTREKKAVALYSIGASIFMIAGKGIIGLITGSLALLTDALHSFLDLTASTITFFAVRISDKPADREHHFGHGKVESLAALAEVLMLFLTCGLIIHEALDRLMTGASPVQLNIWAYIIVIVCIGIDISRVRALKRVAQKHSSQALAADALNFSTDILSSLVVLIGLGAVQLGIPWADAVAAIGVAIFIMTATIRMGKQAIDVLLDRAPTDIEPVIKQVVGEFPEILKISALRVRSDGKMNFGALNLDVDRSLSFSRANALKEKLQRRLKEKIPMADITLTFSPVSRDSELIAESIRFVVSSFNLPLHHLIINQTRDGYFASMHVEMSGDITLDEAHDRSEEIKATLCKSIPELRKVIIHTQPYEDEIGSGLPSEDDADRIAREVEKLVESFPGVEDCHNIVITPYRNGLALSADIRLDGHLPLEKTHLTAKHFEEKLRSEISELVSVTLHLEPLKNR